MRALQPTSYREKCSLRSGFSLEKDPGAPEPPAQSSQSELVCDKQEEPGSVMVLIVDLLAVLQERK